MLVAMTSYGKLFFTIFHPDIVRMTYGAGINDCSYCFYDDIDCIMEKFLKFNKQTNFHIYYIQ